MEYSIKKYSDEYSCRLEQYMHKIAPTFSDEYIRYIVSCTSYKEDEIPSFIVIDENDQIVGCNLFYQTTALINGEEVKTAWGHDTYLNEELRHDLGLDFTLQIFSIPHFGIGLSDINRKLQHKMKTTFWYNLYNYCFPTACLPISLIVKPRMVKNKDKITINDRIFRRVDGPAEIAILNNGFWYKHTKDIDFIRDNEFFERRFFNNSTYTYYVYQLEGCYCYFIVRYVVFKGVPTLYVVDYRYDPEHPEQMSLILRAATKLANQSCLGMVLFMSNDSFVANLMDKKLLKLKKTTDYVAMRSLKVNDKMTSFVTAADSDVDFMRR